MLRPALDNDLGTHVRTGQTILASHAIPSIDAFSWTRAGARWADFEWLYDAMVALLNQRAGLVALILANSLLTGTTIVLVFATLRGRQVSPLLAAAGSAAAWANLLPYNDVRPGMIGALFSALFVFILDKSRATRRWTWLAVLLPCQLLWANSHGSYILGPILCAIYGLAMLWESGSPAESVPNGVEPDSYHPVPRATTALNWASQWISRRVSERLRRAALLGALSLLLLAVSALNPLGVGLLKFTLSASRLQYNRQFIGEWRGPTLQSPIFAPLLITLLLCLALPVLFRIARPDRTHGLLLLVAFAAVLESNEFIPFFAAVGAPTVAQMLAAAIGRPVHVRISTLHLLIFAGTLGLLLIAAVRTLSPEHYQEAVALKFPVHAVSFIESRQLQGPLWNDFGWGAYLINALPRIPVFVDGRAEMYGDDFLQRYQAVESGQLAPWKTFDRYGIRLVLISSDAPLATELRDSAGWRQVFRDKLASVFIRADGPNRHVIPEGEATPAN